MFRLKQSLQALAMPFEIQHNLFEDFANVEDELALEYEHWWEVVRGNFWDRVSDEPKALLTDLTLKFDEMTYVRDKEIWSCESLRGSSDWDDVRCLAQKALKSLHWRVAVPQVSCTVQSRPPRTRDGAIEELSADWVRQILRTGRLPQNPIRARSGGA